MLAPASSDATVRAFFSIASLAVASQPAALWDRFIAQFPESARPAGGVLIGAVGLYVAVWVLRRLTRGVGRAIDRWDGLEANNPRLAGALRQVDRFIVCTAWVLVPLIACRVLGAPPAVTSFALFAVRLYLIVAIGLVVIRCAGLATDVVEALARRVMHRRGWTRYFERLRALLPTLRACLEYGLWIGLFALVLYQFERTQAIAAWGPRLIQAIAIFLAGRLVIELVHLEIEHRMLPAEGLSEPDRRRRATMVPLVRSAFTYAAYFGTLALMLSSMGFNVMPFLAGAGILGLVIGFGAQSMINDVVSGFFILFENIYLVGDLIEVGGARGVVEAIEFRTTRIRDADGRVHIIRNGDMKPVINYSKEYTMAVVSVDVGYDTDLQRVLATMRQAAARLRAANPDVLGDVEVEGIAAFGAGAMTVRTAMKVTAGRHESVAAAFRLLLKETFDREAPGPRRSLIPEVTGFGGAKPAARGFGGT
jgi:small conductance mechanosensitive channel